MLSKTEVIESFGKLLTDYFLFMSNSEIVTKSKKKQVILYNGVTIMTHVFTILVNKLNKPDNKINNDTNDSAKYLIENLLQLCYKTQVCYLEYIEQLDKSNLGNNLYISDISTFLYKLTIGDIDFTDISVFEGEIGNMNSSQTVLLNLIKKVVSIIIFWNNDYSFESRITLCDRHFVKYVKLFYNIPNSHEFLHYLEIIQEKWQMDENTYFVFLNEYYKIIYQFYTKNMLPTTEYIMEKQLLFCSQYDCIGEPTEKNMKDIVKQLF